MDVALAERKVVVMVQIPGVGVAEAEWKNSTVYVCMDIHVKVVCARGACIGAAALLVIVLEAGDFEEVAAQEEEQKKQVQPSQRLAHQPSSRRKEIETASAVVEAL
jgi:hypothetical protein